MPQEPQAFVFPVLSLPPQRESAWVVETTPEETRKWLAQLPLADGVLTAKLLYQALFTLNRMPLDVGDRLAMLEFYRQPVAVATASLQAHFAHFALPLRPRQKQLADFLVQLHMEMAYGYKHVVESGLRLRKPWEDQGFCLALERSVRYLGKVLLRAYQVYMPIPTGVWREVHSLYRYAEQHACERQALAGEDATIARSYLQVLLLGLCGPYQLPQNECHQVNAFLARWTRKARISRRIENIDPVGHFLLDLDADHPAVPFPHDVPLRDAAGLRAVNALELARTVYDFINRLRKGEPPRALDLGFECAGSSCIDALKRMLRFWGMAGHRHFSRHRIRKPLSLCVGVNAIHFFVDGQRPFTPPDRSAVIPEREAVVPDGAMLEAEAHSEPVEGLASSEIFHVDSRWQVRNESAGGLSMARAGDVGLHMRVGDVLGIHNPDANQWRIGVVRWVQSPDTERVEVGVEMLAPFAHPLSVRAPGSSQSSYSQALLLPPIEALHQPATLVVPSGTFRAGQEIEIAEAELPVRRVCILNIVERTTSFSQVVFADVARD
jgi:hypothetical protein